MFLSQLHHIRRVPLIFQIHRKKDVLLMMVGDQRQDLFNGWNLLAGECWIKPTACVKLAELSQGKVSNPTRPVRGAIHRVVVNADQMSIVGSPHVKLEAEAQFKASSEIRQSVLRGVLEQPPMSDDQWARRFLTKDAGIEHKEKEGYRNHKRNSHCRTYPCALRSLFAITGQISTAIVACDQTDQTWRAASAKYCVP